MPELPRWISRSPYYMTQKEKEKQRRKEARKVNPILVRLLISIVLRTAKALRKRYKAMTPEQREECNQAARAMLEEKESDR